VLSKKERKSVLKLHTVAHIINPFVAEKSSDLFTAQPITFKSMVRAKQKAESIIKVELLSAQFKEDSLFIPEEFKQTKHLTQSVLDKCSFEKKIKLPLLHDILEHLYNESDAEYLIYTNVDIGLYENFYLKINEIINAGHDAFIINRRRLSDKYTNVTELEKIYLDEGKSHPGFDCFVFHRSIFSKLKLEGMHRCTIY
jgi:hypothetical protein